MQCAHLTMTSLLMPSVDRRVITLWKSYCDSRHCCTCAGTLYKAAPKLSHCLFATLSLFMALILWFDRWFSEKEICVANCYIIYPWWVVLSVNLCLKARKWTSSWNREAGILMNDMNLACWSAIYVLLLLTNDMDMVCWFAVCINEWHDYGLLICYMY